MLVDSLEARMLFTEEEKQTLAAIGETFLPHFWEDPENRKALQHLIAACEQLPNHDERLRLKRVLRLCDSAWVNGIFNGRLKRFTAMALAERTDSLRQWSQSRLALRRAAFNALKHAVLFTFYTHRNDHGGNPLWPEIGYPGPINFPAPKPKPMQPLQIAPEISRLDCDVVIIGSGAGGGVVAGELAAAGKDVIVLEKGGYYNEADFNQYEAEMMSKLYLDRGMLASRDRGLAVLAGSCLGGGTVINFSTSFSTPQAVREEWAAAHGLPGFIGKDYEESLQTVAARIQVNTGHSRPGNRDRLLQKGLQALGWHCDHIPRNVRGCTQDDACGYCGYGCPRGGKQSTLLTYLQEAYDRGARLIVHAHAEKIMLENNRAIGVQASLAEPAQKSQRQITIHAKAVVVACGAIHSPALLLRSGLRHSALGKNLKLHPATAMWGEFEEEVRPWTGTLQAIYSDQYAQQRQGYGVKFETAPVHPGLFAIAAPWRSGAQFKNLMAKYPRLSVVGILARDREGGRITINRQGLPVVNYRLSRFDREHVRTGLAGAAQILAAAGAKEIFSSQVQGVNYRPGKDRWADFMRRMDGAGYGNNQALYLTFHQMGSCRMGNDAKTSVIDENNEAHGLKGLFVADASAFPSASGVNPMLTIMAIAHRAAQYIAARC